MPTVCRLGRLLETPAKPSAWVLHPSAGMVAYTGQRRAHDDMRTLKDFVDAALGCDCFKLAMEQGD